MFVSIAVAFLAIGVDIGLARLGYGLVLPAIRATIGGSYSVYGAIGAVHLGGYLAGTLAAARFIGRARVQLPRTIGAAQIVVALALAASAFASTPLLLGAARVIVGIASGIGIAAAVTDVLERVSPHRRGVASSIAWAGIGVGIILSAPAGQWAIGEPERWRSVTLWFALTAVLVPLATLGLRPHVSAPNPGGHAERGFAWRDLGSRRYLCFVIAYTCFGVAYISYATFAIAAFARHGISGTTLTIVWFGFGCAAVAGAAGVSRVLAGSWHRYALVLPLAAGAVGCALSLRDGTVAAVVGAVAVGTSLAATPGVASAFARDRSDAATAARAFAAVTACFGCGQMAGPLLSGALADRFGLNAAAVVGAAVFGVGTVVACVDAALMTTAGSRAAREAVTRAR